MNRRLQPLCVLLLIVSLTLCYRDKNYTYDTFYLQFNRTYVGQERSIHQKIFLQNILELEKKIQEGQNLEINNFLDWNHTQLKNFNNFQPPRLNISLSSHAQLLKASLFLPPQNFDWRSLGRVTQVRDQGACGGSWAFSSTAQYESLISIASRGIQYDLSQQYLLQCDTSSKGCQSGSPSSAHKILTSDGMPTEAKYQFKGIQDNFYRNSKIPICSETEKIKFPYKIVQFNSYSNLVPSVLQQHLVDFGPISVVVRANSKSFLFSGSTGQISCPNEQGQQPNHVVLLIGYNKTHWYIKNSWGTNWGNNGYGYIDRSADCSILSFAHVIEAKFQSQITSNVNISVSLIDTGNNGWNGNVIGIRQNGVIVGQFGQSFLNGSTFGPLQFSVNKSLESQIILTKLGSFTNQVGFTLSLSINGSIIYVRNPNSTFGAGFIFGTFCLIQKCQTPIIKLSIALTDQGVDGWNGNVIGLRQNRTIISFIGSQFKTGSSFQMVDTFILGNIMTDIIVLQIGNKTNQVGFTIKLPDNTLVINRTNGSNFYSYTVFKTFCPIGNCTSPSINLSIKMSNDNLSGWGGNVIGFRQNGILVQQIGSNFTSGLSMEVNFTLNKYLKTQIIVIRVGNFSNFISFIIRILNNDTVIFNRSSGKNFQTSEILGEFCIYGQCAPSVVSLSVTMTSNQNTGWGGNILGFKQRDKSIIEFGNNFTSGIQYGPIFVNLEGKIETQIIVSTLGFNPGSIGFTVKTLNGTILYTQNPGFFFTQSTIFTTFCLLGNCPSDLATLSITMSDSGRNGWNGNVIGFRQNGIIVGQFGQNFTNGSSYGPITIKMNGTIQTQIIVSQFANFSNQISFTIRFLNGTVIYVRYQGKLFTSQTIFGRFCPSINCSPSKLTIKIELKDQWGDGWNGNAIGIRQNGAIVTNFGQNFTEGKNFGPLSVTLQNILSEIVVYQFGNFTAQIGFTITALNGTMIFTRNTGQGYNSDIIFSVFCPLGDCPPPVFNKYYVTLSASCNGWNGNILSVKQNGIIKLNLSLASGSSSNPIQISLQRYRLVQIVVRAIGQKTWQVGFVIRTQNGFIVLQRIPGNTFYANDILGSFTPDALNYAPVGSISPRVQNRYLFNEATQIKQENEQPQKSEYLIKSLSISLGFNILQLIIFILFVLFLVKKCREVNELKIRLQQKTERENENIDSLKSLGNEKIKIQLEDNQGKLSLRQI